MTQEEKIAVHVRYMDGYHWLELFTEGHAKAGFKPVLVSKQWFHDYTTHCLVDNLWQQSLSQLSNKQYRLNHPESE